MTKKEFVNVFADLIDQGRRRNHPTMRPSERAMARVGDLRTAEKYWNKHRGELKTNTVAAFLQEMQKPGTEVASA